MKDTNSIIALIASIREKANHFIIDSLSKQGILDLLPAHGAVLNALFQDAPIQMNELARIIQRKKNTVTGLINTLEERGYCYREKDPYDARIQLIGLTPKGLSVKQTQDLVSNKLLENSWLNISVDDQQHCITILQKILNNLS